jgi:hypothetical protein
MINAKILLGFALLAYLGLTLMAYLIAPSMTFLPPRGSKYRSANTIMIPTADNTKIAAQYYPNKNARYTLLYCHGNGTDLGFIQPLMQYYQQNAYAVFAFDYHGYGQSEGKPSESATYLDAEAAYDYLVTQLKISPDRIIVVGKSLGAAVALQLALNRKVAGLVLEAPFLSSYRTITQIPLFPFDRYNNLSKIEKLKTPLLIVHGTADKTIPFWQGKKLYEIATAPKLKLWVDTADHNNLIALSQKQYWQALQQLINLIEKIEH